MMFTSIPPFVKEILKMELSKIDFSKTNQVKLGIKYFLEGVDNRSDREWADLIDALSTYARANETAAIETLGKNIVMLFQSMMIQKVPNPLKGLQAFTKALEEMKEYEKLYKQQNPTMSSFFLGKDNIENFFDSIWPMSLGELRKDREKHFQKLDGAFDDVKKILTSVLSNMDAKEHAKRFLDDDIGKLNEALSQFHGLACSGRVIAG